MQIDCNTIMRLYKLPVDIVMKGKNGLNLLNRVSKINSYL
jgi:hypothetical protein